MKWLDNWAAQRLARRGYWVIPSTLPALIVSYGSGTVAVQDDGSARYVIDMPAGHRLVASYNTVLIEEKT